MKTYDIEQMPDHIVEYFDSVSNNDNIRASKELFDAKEENIDLKTDLTHDEIKLITSLYYNDLHLISLGLNPVFQNYYKKYMRLLVSKDRQSRQEFVNMNRSKDENDTLQAFSNLQNITSGGK